jgi:hypothetical protein
MSRTSDDFLAFEINATEEAIKVETSNDNTYRFEYDGDVYATNDEPPSEIITALEYEGYDVAVRAGGDS